MSTLAVRLRRFLAPRKRVFGIGLAKTGTTSLERVLQDLGYHVAPQARFEQHLDDFAAGRYSAFLQDVARFEAFQDVPFCLPGCFRVVDEAFPGSRFVLTVRNSADEWYDSLCRFHTQLFSTTGKLPTKDELARATYCSPGWVLRGLNFLNGNAAEPYDRDQLIAVYQKHVADVQTHFAGRPESLLVLNVAEPQAYAQLCEFLRVRPRAEKFPHLNASR